MPSSIRLKRIQDQILKIVTEILETKVNDPRIAGVYVTDVTVDRELDYANIYVSSLEGPQRAEEILEGLATASGFIRYSLSQEIDLRVMPKLRFYWDNTPEKADRIETLLAEIKEERESRDDEITPEAEIADEDLDE